ncbi:MAG TPA: pilus assembly protein TadG-related protein [Vicinamibacterales bacterium]|jgi:Flp pilus assembly protein TadG|nr:pilus assembly protein TadG-related protein [Vicinamibacterales bacterium]
MRRIEKLRRDEKGMTYVFVGLGFMAFLSASMLAIDVGMLMTARSQAQNSADSGALAGATALVYDSYTDHSAGGPAVTSALTAAHANLVMGADVSSNPPDVEFLQNPATGEQSRVRVTVWRSSERGNPIPTLIAQYFGVRSASIGAVATAEAAPSNAMDCVKPFTIPDKWIEKQTPAWDPTDTYDAYNNKGQPLANPDIYIPAYNADGSPNPNYTGYNNERDKGTELVIRAGTGNNITPTFYYSLAMTNDTGGDDYRWNIGNCNTTVYHVGDLMVQEPGNMEGPTVQGITDLINRDPNAQWDSANLKVINSAFGSHSPRIFPIPLYDPVYYDAGKRNGRNADLKTANWIGFFAERVSGNNIYGVITPITGIYDKSGPAPNAALPKTIRLVQ